MWDMKKKMCCLGISLLLFLLAGCSEKKIVTLEEVQKEEIPKAETDCVEETESPERKSGQEADSASEAIETRQKLYVYVCGEVAHPGVYELEAGSRVYAAIRAAGGMTEAADDDYLNQAESLQDGQQIYVPSKEETEGSNATLSGTGGMREEKSDKVNLNTAGKEELMTLPGIGEAKAESIIRYREEQGGFQNPEDLMKIEGIKSGVFNKIKEQITV